MSMRAKLEVIARDHTVTYVRKNTSDAKAAATRIGNAIRTTDLVTGTPIAYIMTKNVATSASTSNDT